MTNHRKSHDDDDAPVEQAPEPKAEEKKAEAPSALPEGYEPQKYPATRYHEDGRSKVVQNELDDDTAKADGFSLEKPPEKKAE